MIPEINLLPKYERQSTYLYRLFISGLILVVLLIGVSAYVYFQTKSDITKVDAESQRLTEQKTTLQAQLANATSSEPESLETVISFAEEFVVPTSKLIDELFNVLPDEEHSYISKYSYVFGAVTIESQFETKTEVSQYAANLLGSNYLHDVKVSTVAAAEAEENAIDEDGEVIPKEGERIQEVMPRYDTRFTLDVNLAALKEEAEADE